MAYKRNVEIFEEAYEKKGAKSVLSYVSRDGRKRYVAGSQSPDGGTPMPSGDMTEVTWKELKDKRDAGELTPGSLYRITDYNCTTTQENTQSAGHQFDIVLLALSEDKLAEEGWAMMHDNIYDVTFNDGVIKKCYAFNYLLDGDSYYNIVDCDTMLGLSSEGTDLEIDEDSKTISTIYDSTDLIVDGRTYNYFQNSKLEAWKVWYCLDNDTDRFAWADDSIDNGNCDAIGCSNQGHLFYYYGETTLDGQYATSWKDDRGTYRYCRSSSRKIKVGDTVYSNYGDDVGQVTSVAYDGTGTGLPNGKGVIYRLIDEFNNDCPYDFKNIQFIRKLTDGAYDEDDGTNTWCYTTGETALDIDLSIWHYPTHDLYISSFVDIGVEENTCKYFLPNNVFLIPTSSKLYDTTGCTMMGAPLEMRKCRNVILGDGVSAGVYINCFGMSDDNDERASFYFNNVEVVTGTSGSGDSGDDTTSR